MIAVVLLFISKEVIYKPKSGTKVIKIMLTDANSWLDPSTFRVMFDLRNNAGLAAQQLRPIGGPWSFFRRVKLVCSQTAEDIDFYGRTHEMMHTLTSKASRENDFCEAFGNELTLED